MRGVSILERLAGLCDGVLQSFTQKPQSPLHHEMTVAGGTASAHDSPISATAWTEEWPPHVAAGPPHRPRTCCLPHVRAACGRSVSAGCHPAPATRTAPRAALCVRLHVRLALASLVVAHVVAHASAGSVRRCCFLVLLPGVASLPCSRFRHFFRFVPPEPVKCAPSPRGRAARPFARGQPTDLAIVPSNYIVRAIRAITIRR